ncbi:hypothetical protein Mapa_002812 [Marchantia paleacea]|nr:hypothetical protein Mapa_002812 [Marchantia paleacea]
MNLCGVRHPSSASRSYHIVHSPVLENCGRFPVLPYQYSSHSSPQIQIVLCKNANMQLTIISGGVHDVSQSIVILEDGHIATLMAMGSHASQISKRSRWIGAYCYSHARFGVVRIVHMHPHHVLLRAIIVYDLRSFYNVTHMKITRFVGLLRFEYKTFIFPRPQVL